MDEKSMILEQERQAKAKKKKKRKKYKWIAGILALTLAISGTWYVGWGRYLLAETEADTVKIQVSAGQDVTYAKITAINGNEITYAVAEKLDVELPEDGAAEGETGKQDDGRTAPGGETGTAGERGPGQRGEGNTESGNPQQGEGNTGFGGRGQRQEGSSQVTEGGFPIKEAETTSDIISTELDTGNTQMPDAGNMPEGMDQMPDMGGMPEGMDGMPDMESLPEGMDQMPDMESMPDMSQMFGGEMPDMSQMGNMSGGGRNSMGQMGGFDQMGGFGQMGSNRNNTGTTSTTDTNMFTYEDAVYMVGEESVTTYIPVGTDVTTKLGTVTTFSRLSAGDCVAIVTETDDNAQVIMAVYIIG